MRRVAIGLALFLTSVLGAWVVLGWPAQAQMLSFRSADHDIVSGKRTRVQADLARNIESWHGTRACNTQGRARLALKPAVARWLGGQTVAQPRKRLAQWGYHSGDIWVEQRVVDGKPSCTAGFRKLIAFADFR